jgi:hypothetical protein
MNCPNCETDNPEDKANDMEEDFPRNADDITNEWLSKVLGGTVTGYETTFLEGAGLSDAFKLHPITYDGYDSDAPSSVVVKVASPNKNIREFALRGNAYSKELNFYKHLAMDVPINSPKVYGCFSDGSGRSEHFIIVMEDLTAHSKVFDQVDDPPNEAFSRKIALEAAKMHAKFWESETIELPWIARTDNRYVFSLDAMSKMGRATWTPFRDLYRRMYGSDIFDREEDKPVEELTELLCGPKCVAIHEKICDILTSRPKTLLHGDMRADNIFRTNPAVGKSVEDTTITFIDWQTIHAGPPGAEFTPAWMHSLEPEQRRKDKDILKQYHDKLVELNPAAAAYTYDMLLEDYSLSFCLWWTTIITLGVDTLPNFDKPEGAPMKKRWGKGLFRSKSAMLDLDCLSLVKKLACG